MKKIVFIVLLCVIGNYANGQIRGVKGLKNKATKAVKSDSKVDPKKAIKAREFENEAQEKIDLLEGYFSNINNVSTETIEKTIYDLKSKLSTIERGYSEVSTRLKSLQESYAKYKDLASKEYEKREIASKTSNELRMFSEKADLFRDGSRSSYNLVNYAEYKELNEAFGAQSNKDATTTGYVENLEDYFNNYIPNVYSKELKDEFLKNNYFDDAYWMKYPKTAISEIDSDLGGDLEEFKPFSKQTEWIDETIQMLKEQKLKVIDYKDNGGLEAFKAKGIKDKADKVFPSKSVSNDAAVIGVVKKSHSVEHSGAIQKVIIISDWYIKKNEIGIPLEKYILVEVITKKDGECFLNSGRVFRTYEGGGSYGNKKLSFYSDSDLMNCANF